MLNKYGNKFQEVSDSGDETYYVRHFGVCQIGEKDIELAVVANIKNLDGYISASEIPKEGKFQLSTSLVPYPKYMSKKLLEEANDDGVSVSDNELVNVDNYMGGLNYSPSEIVYFKDSESAESYLMSKELNDSIDGNATMIGYVLDKNYNRIGQTNWDYLRYMIGETERFANGGAVNAKSAKKRLEYLRKELRAERISYGELVELQSLKEYIDSGDVELLQAAGVPEFEQQVVDEEYYEEGSFYKLISPFSGIDAGGVFMAGKYFDDLGWQFFEVEGNEINYGFPIYSLPSSPPNKKPKLKLLQGYSLGGEKEGGKFKKGGVLSTKKKFFWWF
jgi:hypothetical protein